MRCGEEKRASRFGRRVAVGRFQFFHGDDVAGELAHAAGLLAWIFMPMARAGGWPSVGAGPDFQGQRPAIPQPSPSGWVEDPQTFPAPQRGAISMGPSSAPNITFIENHAVPFQQAPIFVLESHFQVMFGLVLDVGNHRIGIGLADGKCAVARLPMELVQVRSLGFEPFGGAGFHRFDHLCDGAGAREPKS